MTDFPASPTWLRGLRSKIAASTAVLTSGGLLTDEQGNAYVGNNGPMRLLQRLIRLDEQARRPDSFGDVSGGTSGNHTAVIQAAFDWAVSTGGTLRSDPAFQYTVDPIRITGPVTLLGDWNFLARTMDQEVVLDFLSNQNDLTAANVFVNGNNRAVVGIRGSAFGRSDFAKLNVQSCQLYGVLADIKQDGFNGPGQPTKAINNSQVHISRLRTVANGQLSIQLQAKCLVANAAPTSLTGFSRWQLTTPVPAKYLRFADDGTLLNPGWVQLAEAYNSTYRGARGTRPYLQGAFGGLTNGAYTTVDIACYDGAVDELRDLVLYIGGGLCLPKHSDNNNWVIDNHDSADRGVGVLASPLYGFVLSNGQYQSGGIGIGIYDYTLGAIIEKPYFENMGADVAVHRYVQGILTGPVWTGENRYWNNQGALRGIPHYDEQLEIITGKPSALTSDVRTEVNPSATARVIQAGNVYSYERTTAGPLNFTLNNDGRSGNRLAVKTLIQVVGPAAGTGIPVTIALANSVVDGIAQTIEGAQSWTGTVAGRTLLSLDYVASSFTSGTWRVTAISPQDRATSIANAPVRVGQFAIVGTNVYYATGTSSTADWTLLNGGGAAPTPSLAGRIGKTFSNEYRAPSDWLTATTAQPVDQVLNARRIDLGVAQAWDGLAVNVTVAQAGGATTARLMVFGDDGNGRPDYVAGPLVSTTLDLTAGTGSRLALFGAQWTNPLGTLHIVWHYTVQTGPTTPATVSTVSTVPPVQSGVGPANQASYRGRTITTPTVPAVATNSTLSTSTALPIVALHAV